MMRQILAGAGSAVRPLARRALRTLLDSNVGNGVGSLRVARRFAKQWAASAGLYDEPPAAATSTAAQPASPASTASRTSSSVSAAQRPVVLYTSRRHSSCKTAKRHLDEDGIVYEERDLSDDEVARQRLFEETHDRTFPQVYIDGKRLGGFDDLMVAREDGRLHDLLYPSREKTA